MKYRQPGIGFLIGLVMSVISYCCGGCALGNSQEAHIHVANLTINDQPANLYVDTGTDTTMIMGSAASRLNISVLKEEHGAHSWVDLALDSSKPSSLTWDGHTYEVPLPVAQTPWFFGLVAGDLDGVLGWPALRRDVLFFDADSHVVRPLVELPPGLEGWVKLKIKEASSLQLEMPRTDGAVDILFIDTGAPIGLGLPSAQWKEWRPAHPQAPTGSLTYGGMDSIINTEEVWVDDIKLGPLAFTDLPVCEVDESEAKLFKNFAGTLGMYALERMDLIVDGPNAYAYLRPRPLPGPPYPRIKRPGISNDPKDGQVVNPVWALAPGVRLDFANEWMAAGEKQELQKDYKTAIQYYSRALEMEPGNPEALYKQGRAYFSNRDARNALADLDASIARNPQNADAYYCRGRARQVLHDLPGALADFDLAVKMQPPSAYYVRDRGSVYGELGKFNEAIADFTTALGLDPHQDWTFFLRATARQKLGDVKGAIADCDQAIALNPHSAEAYFKRAVLRQIDGKFAEAVGDYDQAAQLKLNGLEQDYLLLYRELARRRANGGTANYAQTKLALNSEWTNSLGQFIQDSMDENTLLANAEKEAPETVIKQQCEAYFVIGEMHLIRGDAAGARAFFEKCLGTNQTIFLDYDFAKAELGSLTPASKTAP